MKRSWKNETRRRKQKIVIKKNNNNNQNTTTFNVCVLFYLSVSSSCLFQWKLNFFISRCFSIKVSFFQSVLLFSRFYFFDATIPAPHLFPDYLFSDDDEWHNFHVFCFDHQESKEGNSRKLKNIWYSFVNSSLFFHFITKFLASPCFVSDVSVLWFLLSSSLHSHVIPVSSPLIISIVKAQDGDGHVRSADLI